MGSFPYIGNMNHDTTSKRATILRCLTEGMIIRATSRITGSSTTTVLRTIEDCGEACNAYQDKHLRGLPVDFLQMDELFCFVGCREKAPSAGRKGIILGILGAGWRCASGQSCVSLGT